MSWFGDLANGVIPTDDSDQRALRAWRVRIAIIACAAFLLVVSLILPALFVGLPNMGRVAWATAVAAETDDKISKAVQPLQKDIADLRVEVKAQTAATNAVLAEIAYREVFELTRRRCKSADEPERDRLWRDILANAARYRQYSGIAEFDPPRCTDL